MVIRSFLSSVTQVFLESHACSNEMRQMILRRWSPGSRKHARRPADSRASKRLAILSPSVLAMTATGSGKTKMDQETKAALERLAIVKLLIQRICTPVPAERRLTSICRFFSKHGTEKFSQKELMLVWKGLFYAIWYSEMGKGCEETMEAIVSQCQQSDQLLLTGLRTLVNEWRGIDSIRLDKFAYFARRLFNAMLTHEVRQENKGLLVEKVIHEVQDCAGLMMQLCNVFIEELIRVLEHQADGKFSVVTVLSLLRPFISLLSETRDSLLQKTIIKEILVDSVVKVTDSCFADHATKYHKWLSKTLLTFAEATPVKRQQRVLLSAIERLNSEEELDILFQAADQAANPRKRKLGGKRFYGKRKEGRKRVRCNL